MQGVAAIFRGNIAGVNHLTMPVLLWQAACRGIRSAARPAENSGREANGENRIVLPWWSAPAMSRR